MAIEQKKFTYQTYDPEKNSAYTTASGEKNKMLGLLSGKYIDSEGKLIPQTTSVDDALKGYLQDYQKRNETGFSYDFNADALYQQYKDKHIQQGKMAMQDTMGQAAAMTGGYGNSYAQSVGQQAYQASLDNLNDIIPELYQMAYDRYNQEGQDLLNTITLLRGERDHEISMSNDEYGKLMDMLGYYTTEEQNAYNRGYTEHSDAQKYAYQAVADENAYNQALAQLGLSERQVALQEKEYANKYDSSTKEYSGTTKTGASYNNGALTTAQVKALQAKLGVTADGYYGSVSSKAAGGLSAEEAYKKFVGGKIGEQPTGFTGSSYSDAVSYMKANGVPSANASSVMTAQEWSRRKASYSASGTGNSEVKNYSSYKEYLQAFVEYTVENYGK